MASSEAAYSPTKTNPDVLLTSVRKKQSKHHTFIR